MSETPESHADRLEPFFDDVDVRIRRVRDLARYGARGESLLADDDPGFFSVKGVRFFESSGIAFKSLWYHYSRIETLDREYDQIVKVPFQDPGVGYSIWYRALPNGRWAYYPFFEAMELAALLGAARATVEMFCQGTSLLFGAVPTPNLGALKEVLSRARGEPRAAQLVTIASTARTALAGLVFDPKVEGKKALRNLMQHLEAAPIRFIVGPDGKSQGALIEVDHPQLIHFVNTRVVVLVGETWHQTRQLLSQSLPIIGAILEDRRAAA
jgi:hypothetical protein